MNQNLAIPPIFRLSCGSGGAVHTFRAAQRERHRVPRRRMVERLAAAGVSDPRVLDAIAAVPRHLLVPEALAGNAYDENRALPIGEGQTISAPHVVAAMTAALELTGRPQHPRRIRRPVGPPRTIGEGGERGEEGGRTLGHRRTVDDGPDRGGCVGPRARVTALLVSLPRVHVE